ncbi:unnamed protein product [Rotaria magnacalcarata]|uniref:Uncharacterized protein n=2 Tax=Rotaria magnacalcarata TaxID=392030 RepID=A0A820FXK9_9BILA|nr:unnamed protein product [Rotaria magnacalcarata]
MTSDLSKKTGSNQEEGAGERATNTGMGQNFPSNSDSMDNLKSLMQFLSQQWANGNSKIVEDLKVFLQQREISNNNGSQGATNSSAQQINYNISIPNNNNNNVTEPCATFAERNENIKTLPMFEGSSEKEWRKYLIGYEAIALKGTDRDSHRVILELGKKLSGITKTAFEKLYKHGQKYAEITGKISNFLRQEHDAMAVNTVKTIEETGTKSAK